MCLLVLVYHTDQHLVIASICHAYASMTYLCKLGNNYSQRSTLNYTNMAVFIQPDSTAIFSSTTHTSVIALTDADW